MKARTKDAKMASSASLDYLISWYSQFTSIQKKERKLLAIIEVFALTPSALKLEATKGLITSQLRRVVAWNRLVLVVAMAVTYASVCD